MGFYGEQILPRVMSCMMRGEPFVTERPRCVGLARGRVLEIGFGAGLNLSHYSPEVSELVALEPATVCQKLAARRVAAAPFPVRFLALSAERIPLEAESVDCVVSTWTLCTIPDVGAALSELLRVLKPGGRLHFLEHGRSRDPRVARWQDRLTPLQKLVGGGCHLNRPIDELVRGAGLGIVALEEFHLPRAPRVAGCMYRGSAERTSGE